MSFDVLRIVDGAPVIASGGYLSVREAASFSGLSVPEIIRAAATGRVTLHCRLSWAQGVVMPIGELGLHRVIKTPDGKIVRQQRPPRVPGRHEMPDDIYEDGKNGVEQVFLSPELADEILANGLSTVTVQLFHHDNSHVFVPDKLVTVPVERLAVPAAEINVFRRSQPGKSEGNMTFISYIRVSTARQGASGLGLEAQQVAVSSYVQGRGELIMEVREVESGRKCGKARPELARALAMCKLEKAALVIGKLDRLARDVRFFLEVIDDSGVDIRFADLPDVCPTSDEGRMILVSMANFAEFEGRRIGTRTRAALAAAKARGVKLGVAGPQNLKRNIEERSREADAFAGRLGGIVAGMRARGFSQRGMRDELNAVGVPTAKGGQWSLIQVQRLLARLNRVEMVARGAGTW